MRFEKRDSGLLVPDVKLVVGGRFHGLIIRDGEVVDEFEDKNIITNQGLDYLLGVAFGLVAQISNWYMAPFAGNYSPVGTDTAASLPGNATEATNYSGSTRPAFTPVEASQQVGNAASPATLTFSSNGNVYGAYIVSAGAQGATSGVALAAAQFATVKQVQTGDQLLLTYTIGAATA